jgi:ABC-type transport system involved in cytochrome c biogenesis permease subunit
MEEKNIILSLMFFTMAFAFYFITAVLYIGNLIFKKRWIGLTATAMACIAVFSISMMLIARAGESGHAPFSNLYESMALFVWAMTIGYLVIEFKYKLRVLGSFVMSIAFLALVSASMLPYKYKSVEPLNPALQSKWHWMVDLLGTVGLEKYAIGWLDFHVFATFIGYAAFAIAFGISLMYIIKEKFERTGKSNFLIDKFPSAKLLDEISYRAIAWGFPFLALGIVTGAVWANYAWGTYWSWDPKETWSLITWFVYAAYLHGRVTRGWRGKKCAYLSVLGFLAVIFLYWGVSFILPGLHAYA